MSDSVRHVHIHFHVAFVVQHGFFEIQIKAQVQQYSVYSVKSMYIYQAMQYNKYKLSNLEIFSLLLMDLLINDSFQPCDPYIYITFLVPAR